MRSANSQKRCDTQNHSTRQREVCTHRQPTDHGSFANISQLINGTAASAVVAHVMLVLNDSTAAVSSQHAANRRQAESPPQMSSCRTLSSCALNLIMNPSKHFVTALLLYYVIRCNKCADRQVVIAKVLSSFWQS